MEPWFGHFSLEQYNLRDEFLVGLLHTLEPLIDALRNRFHVSGSSKISKLMSERVMHRFGAISRHIEIDVADLDLAAFVLVTVVEALTHAPVLRRPDILTGEKARQFVDDVTRLVVGYLRTS